ncbi:MG2 domain-containing protein [Leeuwenhoekiella sp. LLG6367-2.1]|uniref:MG2 domain-containing protein n=1 Tax=Leeuwenhoekiella sp. LLG6367-2.1 TaxID=3160833 RepID=UPI00386DD222
MNLNQAIYAKSVLRLTLCAFLFFTTFSRAQEQIAQEAFAEKVYLQIDKSVYQKGETLWFKAIVTQAKDHQPSPLSKTLHVELIDANDKIIDSKQIPLEQGVGSNSFELPYYYLAGAYQLRGYTEWNRNFGDAFTFKTHIQVLEDKASQTTEVFKILNASTAVAGNQLEVLIKPEFIDTTAGAIIDVHFAIAGNTKTYAVAKNEAGDFIFKKDISSDAQWSTLTVETPSGARHTEFYNLAKPDIDLQFFPESGNFVAGITNLVGFKALDHTGKGVLVEGEVVDGSGVVVGKFRSNTLGMGQLFLVPKKATKYRTRLTKTDALYETKATYFDLPEVSDQGTLLNVKLLRDKLLLSITSTEFLNDSIAIQVASRGISHGNIYQKLNEGKLTLPVDKSSLPAGIIVFTLFDVNKKPLAERLYYNDLETQFLDLNIGTDKLSYRSGEEVTAQLNIANLAKETVLPTVSAVVVDSVFSAAQAGKSIQTYMLLSSELKGTIENATSYFDKNNSHRQLDLDALMLTQGYRNYTFISDLKTDFDFEPELGLYVKGDIAALLAENKKKENVEVSLMIFGEQQSFYKQQTDSLGRFYFPLPQIKGNRLRAVLQTKNDAGRQRDYTLNLNKLERPEVDFKTIDKVNNIVVMDSEFSEKIRENSEDLFFDYDPTINQLDEIILDSYEMTPQRKKVQDLYGKPDVIFDGDKIRDSQQNWSFGLFSVLRAAFGNEITFLPVTDSTGTYLKPRIQAGDETLILVDGITVRNYEYQLLQNLSTADIKSVEIIKETSSNYQQLYREANPFSDYSAVPSWGSILAIYTYSGNGIFTAYKSKGILKTTIPVYATSKKFYVPKYENIETQTAKNHLETTLYWDPNILTDKTGTAKFSFYNSDLPGTKTILIEALSPSGKTGYSRYEYTVLEK